MSLLSSHHFLFEKLELSKDTSYWFRAHPKDPILTQLPAKTFPSKVTLTGTGDRAPVSSGGTQPVRGEEAGSQLLEGWPGHRCHPGCHVTGGQQVAVPTPGQFWFCPSPPWRCRCPRCSCLVCRQLVQAGLLLLQVTPPPSLSTTGVCPPTGTCGVTPRGCTSAPRLERSLRPCSGPG